MSNPSCNKNPSAGCSGCSKKPGTGCDDVSKCCSEKSEFQQNLEHFTELIMSIDAQLIRLSGQVRAKKINFGTYTRQKASLEKQRAKAVAQKKALVNDRLRSQRIK